MIKLSLCICFQLIFMLQNGVSFLYSLVYHQAQLVRVRGKFWRRSHQSARKGHFSSRAGESAARIFLEAISSPPLHFSPNVVGIRSCCTKGNTDYNFFATKILLE